MQLNKRTKLKQNKNKFPIIKTKRKVHSMFHCAHGKNATSKQASYFELINNVAFPGTPFLMNTQIDGLWGLGHHFSEKHLLANAITACPGLHG
jgi:hypothetical protein